jgi:hypothetical protein
MGLDVRAFKNVKLVSDPRVSEADDLTRVNHGAFVEQCGDLEDGGYYDCEQEGWFCRMGYGHYGRFRNELAKLGGWPEFKVMMPGYNDPDYENKSYYHRYPNVAAIYNSDGDEVNGPFVEVICFSDCGGFICADFCKKLFQDFVDHQEVANELFKDNPDYLDMYNGLRAAFKFGSNNGFVQYT